MGPVHGGLLGSSTTPLISRAVLIDREVDIITPMMTQITFEGLVDEVTGIRNGAVPWVPKGEPTAIFEYFCQWPSSDHQICPSWLAGGGQYNSTWREWPAAATPMR